MQGLAVIIGIWLLIFFLKVLCEVVKSIAGAVQAGYAFSRPGLTRMSRDISYRLGKSVGFLARAGVLTPDIVAILAVLFVFLFTKPIDVTINIDELGGKVSPLIGWLLVGFIFGCLVSVTVRVRDFGWFGSKSLFLSIPNIECLRAGENEALRIRKWKFVVGLFALSLTSSFVGLSWWTNSHYPYTSESEEIIVKLREAAKNHDITLINRALSDAANILGQNATITLVSDYSSALKILGLIKSFEKDVNGPVKRAGEAASRHIALYRNKTFEMVKSGQPGALNRSLVFLDVDRRSAAFWIGQLYETGKGGAKKDLLKAFAFYGDAARLGNKVSGEALEILARSTIGDSDEGVRRASFSYFDPKARQGNPLAQYWLGKWYEKNQDDGSSQNKSVEMFLKAANQDGDKFAQVSAFLDLSKSAVGHQSSQRLLDKLAPAFASGDNMEAKLAAYTYLEARAGEGDPGAQLWTGYRYREGDGIAKDMTKAQTWFAKAATQDSNEAVQQRARATLLDFQKGTR